MGKLVRDLIPEIIESDGRVAERRTLTDKEYDVALLAKLREEVTELAEAAPGDRLEEAADVYEVLLALLAGAGLDADDLMRAAAQKRAERGGFPERVWLEPGGEGPDARALPLKPGGSRATTRRAPASSRRTALAVDVPSAPGTTRPTRRPAADSDHR